MSVKAQADAGALESEILRNVLDTVTHDLGGLSSALALRADVMQRTAPSAAVDACSAIAGELRVIGNQLREMSGPRGAGALSPLAVGSLERWLAFILRFGQPLLNRGVLLRGHVEALHVSPAAAHELTYIALALLNALRESTQPAHSEISVLSSPAEDAVIIRFGARLAQQPVPIVEDVDNEWWNWAVQRAESSSIRLQVVDGQVELTMPRVVAPGSHG